MPVSQVQVRVQFFDYLFGEEEGYLCIATASPTAMQTSFTHKYFEWPGERELAATYIQKETGKNHVWFCVSLLKAAQATKDNCLPGSFIWADLDSVSPADLQMKSLPATAMVETSPGRFQGFWRLDYSIPADVREDLTKKVTYYVEADKGGWARNKLMRVPFTINHKYESKPIVELLNAYETLVPVELFDGLPDPPVNPDTLPPAEMPDITQLAEPANIIYKYSYQLHDTGFANLYGSEPHETEDWSKRMWRLINLMLDAGLSKEETFSLAIGAACNKYKRDNRPLSYLWREVLKADGLRTKSITILGEYKPLTMPELFAEVEEDTPPFENFITQYKDWASVATDAVIEYHELCAFVLLSALASANIKLNASFGRLVPNIWGLVLGDSTLTRKTTAMEMAMGLLREVDDSMVVATDGSPEGILTALSQRQDQVSIFYKDEVSGLFNAMNTKAYLSDMPEVLTKMYDVPSYYPRTLKKDVIVVRNPYFIFFGGGIKDKVYSLIDEDYILSGFLPRFLIVNGYADLSKLRATGPPDEDLTKERNKLLDKVTDLYAMCSVTISTKVGSQIVQLPQSVDARLTPEAWDYYAEVERTLVQTASESPNSMVALPTFTRMAFSGLKMGILLAATRGPDSAKRVTVTKQDLEQSFWYIQRWGRHSIDLILNAGISKSERMLEKVLSGIRTNPGCNKSLLMNQYKIVSKDMNDILQTLSDRGLIEVRKHGKGMLLWAIV